MPRNPACAACKLGAGAVNPCVWGEQIGSPSPVMVIGEAPGAMEDQQTRPFVGASGKLLRSTLETVGLKDYYLTNVVKCRPPDNKLPDTAKALKPITLGCRPYLDEEIATVQPKFILALGNTPLEALTGHRGITKHRGTPYKVTLPHGEVTVFPAYHPAYVLRGPGLDKIFRLDLNTFLGLVNGITGEDFWAPMNNVIVTKASQLDEIATTHIERLEQGFVQTYDIETMGYWTADGKYVPSIKRRSSSDEDVCAPEEGEITWVGVAYHHEDGRNVQYIIPFEHPKCGVGWRRKAYELLWHILEDKRYSRVGQNGPYDDRWLASRGILPYRTYDLFNGAYLLDENIPHGLETTAKLEVGAPVWGEDFDYSKLDTMPFAEVADYLGKDLYATGRSYFAQRKKIAADQGLARVFKHILMPADRLCCRAQQHGLWVYEDVLDEKTKKFNGKRDKATAELNAAYAASLGLAGATVEVNWNSTQQKQRILFEELGLPIYKVSKKTSLPSTDKDVLSRLEDETEHPVVVALRVYQKVEMLCRFLKRWRTRLDKAKLLRGEPRIYTQLNAAKTNTGRLSSVDPDGTGDNLQQVPSRGEGAELREIFGAPPGYDLFDADYSQIEMRDAAFVCPEPTLKRLFREDKDTHTYTASIVMHKPMEEITKDERKRAKPVNFGFLFKMKPKKFVRYALTEYGIKFTLREAQAVHDAFFRAYPGLLSYYKRTEEEVRTTGQVRYYTGRIRRLPDIYSPDEYVQEEAIRQAINAKIQGPANDKCLLAGIEIQRIFDELGLDAYIVLFVHDAIMGFSRPADRELIAKIVKETMEQYVPKVLKDKFGVDFDVPLKADLAIIPHGKGWGHEEEFKIH